MLQTLNLLVALEGILLALTLSQIPIKFLH